MMRHRQDKLRAGRRAALLDAAAGAPVPASNPYRRDTLGHLYFAEGYAHAARIAGELLA